MPKYIKLHLGDEVIYLNPECIVGFESSEDMETIIHLSHSYYSNNSKILIVKDDIHTICRMLDIEE